MALTMTYVAVKFYNSATWELFCSFLFLYGKVASIVLFAMSSLKGAAYFSVLCFVLWLTLNHPRYSEPSKLIKAKGMSDLVEKLQFQSEKKLLETINQSRDKTLKKDFASIETTILVFTASWADQCYYTHPMWIRFANRFSTNKVKFIECDASRFEKLCHKLHISTSNMANQLPTLMLLEDNVEYLRFPPIDVATGKAGRVVNYKERELIKYFELEARCLAT